MAEIFSDRNFAHYASMGIYGVSVTAAAYRGHMADMGRAIKK